MRIVRSDDGSLAVGRTLPGRGAWLCDASPACLDLALRRKAFRAPVSDGAPESLRAYLMERARIGSCDM